jgi:hypothetical protein
VEADILGVNNVLMNDYNNDMRPLLAKLIVGEWLDPDPIRSAYERDQAGLNTLSRFAAEGSALDGEHKPAMRPQGRAEL